MILITWFQVHYTKFLPPPLKAASGLLVVASITLLAIVWVTTFKMPFSHWELHILLSRLWKKNSNFLTFSLNVQMFLHLLFSLNCLIPPKVTTWHPMVFRWNCWLQVFNVLPCSYHNLVALQVVLSMFSLACMLWCYKDIPSMSCEIWIIIKYLFKKFIFANCFWCRCLFWITIYAFDYA